MANRIVIVMMFIFATSEIFSAYNMTIGEIIDLYKKGVGVDVIVATIDAKDAEFVLSSDDILRLKDAGVPETLITFMITRKSKVTPQQPDLTKFQPKIGTINISCSGSFSESYKSEDLYIYACLAIDDEIRIRKRDWDKINVLYVGNSEVYSFKSEWQATFSLPVKPGEHKIDVYLYIGDTDVNDYNIKSYKIYEKNVSVSEGEISNLNINIKKGTTNSSKYIVKEGD
ncbi:MAG: hypothetical protein ACUVWP_00725 [bacterium]